MSTTTTNPPAKYPYPSTVNVANFVSIKLSHKNFLLWKTQILGLIESQDLFGFIDGSIPTPASTIETTENGEVVRRPNPDFSASKKSDCLLRGWITGSLTEEVLGLVVGHDTTAQVWKTLTGAFARESKDREIMLTRKLQLFRKQDKPVTEYVTGFKAICDELAAIGKPLTDDDKVFWLVNGLGSGYESFMTSILKPPVPPYLDVVSLLQGHETMKELHAGETRLNSQMAFFTRQSNSQNNRRRYNNNWRNNNNNTNPRFNSKGRTSSPSREINATSSPSREINALHISRTRKTASHRTIMCKK
ncbi:hypothetical protein EJ110_NYTH29082 [Nymphaea thermarum]|nr:hypothetical protein EJ110_NYTH29082 [Nymphaea thermarum]